VPHERLVLEDLEAELAAVTAALAEARAEVDVLRELLGDGREALAAPSVTVDPAGVVLAVDGWTWAEPPTVGAPLGVAFTEDGGRVVARLAQREWIGVDEHHLVLRAGRAVALEVAPVEGGHRIAFRDVSAQRVLDLATEHRRRMRAVSQLAGALARELSDPMSIVQGRLELLLDLGVNDGAAVRKHLGVALDHSRRVSATLRNLRLVGRTAAPTAPVPFRSVVDEAIDLIGPRAGQVVVRIEPDDLAIGCDQALTARACASLARQALEAAGRGIVQLRARRVRSHVVVRIGAGGRASGEPLTELDDLALDRTLLASVGGTLAARRVGSAPQFELTLPTPTVHRARRRPVRGRLLLVAPTLGQAVHMLLERDGYDFVVERTADGATRRMEEQPCDVVVTELLLDDGDSGLSLAELFDRRWPGAPVVLVAEELPVQIPPRLTAIRWPASRRELLAALGRARG
jgi:signal transduction histidine kinase